MDGFKLAALFALVVPLGLSGCSTVGAFKKEYRGYSVEGKRIGWSVKEVPVWLSTCVRPDRTVRCSNKYESETGPTLVCPEGCDEKNGDKWYSRQVGIDKKNVPSYNVEMKSPTNEQLTKTVPQEVYEAISVGQVISDGKSAIPDRRLKERGRWGRSRR